MEAHTQTNFQSEASKQGAEFEALIVREMQAAGHTIMAQNWTHPTLKVEIDIISIRNAQYYWVECKGSWRGTQPGLKRTDTVKKLIGSAAILQYDDQRNDYLYIAATNHLPTPGTAGHTWLHHATLNGLIDQIWDYTLTRELQKASLF